jgi:hypothetical protein
LAIHIVSNYVKIVAYWFLSAVQLALESPKSSEELVLLSSIVVLSTIEVIDVEILNERHCLIVEVRANRRVRVREVHLIPVVDALIGHNLAVETLRNHVPSGQALHQLTVCVQVVVGLSVTYDEARQIVGIVPPMHVLDQVPLVDLPG